MPLRSAPGEIAARPARACSRSLRASPGRVRRPGPERGGDDRAPPPAAGAIIALPVGLGRRGRTGADGLDRVGAGRRSSVSTTCARPVRTVAPAIPTEWRAKGYTRLGDVDIAGGSVYVAVRAEPTRRLDSSGRRALRRDDAAVRRRRRAPPARHRVRRVDARHAGRVLDRPRRRERSCSGTTSPTAGVRSRRSGLGRTIEARAGRRRGCRRGVALDRRRGRHGVYRVDRPHRSGHRSGIGRPPRRNGGRASTRRRWAGPRCTWRSPTAGRHGAHGFAVVGDADARDPSATGHSGWPPVLVMGAVALVVVAGGAARCSSTGRGSASGPRPGRT